MQFLANLDMRGVDSVNIQDKRNNNSVTFIREGLVEQREADLLKSLETSEDTVAVLEELLTKYAQEVIRLRQYNDVLRMLTQAAPALPTPPSPSTLPWVWPTTTPLPTEWQRPSQITCLADVGQVDKIPEGYVDIFQLMEALRRKPQ